MKNVMKGAMKGAMKLIGLMVAVPLACAGLALFLMADMVMEMAEGGR